MNLRSESLTAPGFMSVSTVDTGDLPVKIGEVRAWCRAPESVDDPILYSLVSEVISQAEEEFNLSIINKTVTATFQYGSLEIVLPYAPVLAITSVVWDGATLDADDYTRTGELLRFDRTRTGQVVVTYTTGYTQVPSGLILAIKKAVLSSYDDREDIAQGGIAELPSSSRRMFRKFKNYP